MSRQKQPVKASTKKLCETVQDVEIALSPFVHTCRLAVPVAISYEIDAAGEGFIRIEQAEES